MYSIIVFVTLLINTTLSLNNGLALTPPMGWLTWERFRCITDCKSRPDECISEKLILSTTDYLVSEGYAAVGYEYVGIDDCWLEKQRDENGKLEADKVRFPNGMKYVGDYIHKKGLKFALYEDYGNTTCAGYPGMLGHLETDVNTFAEWGVDYIKVDACDNDGHMDKGYPEIGKYLNKTGRPIVYSCSWPAYSDGDNIPYDEIIKTCNLWRNEGDIQDSWDSVLGIMGQYGTKTQYATYAGPGHWNDPDMLIIGNFGLSYDQSKVQMAVWAILAAPLLISADLTTMRPEFKEILLNKHVIAIDQDPLGRAGSLHFTADSVQVWRREVTPLKNDKPSLAFAFVNLNTDGYSKDASFTCENLGITSINDYNIQDLFEPNKQTWEISDCNLLIKANPTGKEKVKKVL